MPKLTTHPSQRVTKMLAVGNSGTGKTGALASLAEAGYTLGILDYDNGLDILRNATSAAAQDRIFYETLTERRKMVAGQLVLDGMPSVLPNTLKLLNNWPELGPVSTWGPDRVLVLDSLTFFAKAVFEWVEASFHYRDRRQSYGEAQRRVENLLGLLYSPVIPCNIYVASHLTFIELVPGTLKAYPAVIGRALSPTVTRYFNTCVEFHIRGIGPTAKRVIATGPTGTVDVKTATLPSAVPGELPVETGLATLFQALQGETK